MIFYRTLMNINIKSHFKVVFHRVCPELTASGFGLREEKEVALLSRKWKNKNFRHTKLKNSDDFNDLLFYGVRAAV